MKSAPNRRFWRPVAFVALVVATLVAMAGSALAVTEPNVEPPPDIQPNDGALQAYCDENYPGTTGIVFSTGSATTNSQGELTKTEAGYTLTWVEAIEGDDFDIRVVSVTEAGDTEHLSFSLVVTFLGGNDANGYAYEEPISSDELIVDGSNGNNITFFGFCAITTGEIKVEKVTDPAGSTDTFDFTASWDGDGFSLSDGGSENSGPLEEGTYSVAETVPDGWDLTSATCDNGDDPGAINLEIGDTIICTFMNQADANIIVEKQTNPDGSTQEFTFTTSYGDDFNLTDGQTNDSGDLDPGTYSVAETVPDGWALDSVECSDGSNPGAISLQAGETVTCVFNNQQNSNIIVEKQTNPDGSPQLFTFTTDYGDDFQLADGQTNDSGNLDPGTYSVAETVPDGWSLESVECSDGSDPGAIALAAGETVTCVFTNEQDSVIIVEKETDPDGSTQPFTFTTDYGDDFQLADGETNNSGDLDPGTYSVAETVPDGWELDSATCDDGSDPGAIALAAGETVTCTFYNQADANIIIAKQTDPDGSTQEFTFVTSYSPIVPLADGQTNDSGDLDPGTYSVAEIVPDGWALTSEECDDGSDPGAIDLQAGETVTCVFTNTQDGRIIVEKQTDPADSPQEFTFTTSYGDDFVLTDNGTNDSGNLAPGTYSVAEIVPDGWELDSVECSDGSDPEAISVQPGETVTCVFNNQADANIIVEKQTNPADSPQEFTFTTSYGDDFVLTDNGTNVSGDLDPGTYSVAETVPDGWELDLVVCSDGSDPGAIALAAGETVTCTFYNEADAGIVVQKQTEPDGSTQAFDFSSTYGADFQLADGESNASGDLDPGTYSVAETVPDGWELTSAECSDGSSPGSISLQAGETVVCVFTNTQDGQIVVEKQTNPDGSTQPFTFTTDYGDDFQLADGETNNSGNLAPGTYSVAETVPDGWALESATCDDGSDPGAIDLAAGELVTCVFTNIQDGQIVVEKRTLPTGSPQTFTFTTDYGDDFQLADGETNNSGNLAPGTYSVAETVPDGWALESATCDDGSDPGAIDLAAGELVTCVFTNIQDGQIVVEKQTNPDGSTQPFTFTTDYGDDFQLADGETNNSGNLAPGTYSVAETVPDGWDLTSAECDDDSDPGAIDLGPGETVTCTFTNTQRGMVELTKLNNGLEETTVEWTFTLTGPEVDTSDTTPPALLDFGGAKLIPGETYTVCETGIPAGWATEWTVDGVVVEPYDNGSIENDTLCVDFTVEPGQTLGIVVNNVPPPGGGQRTPGYWKNWNECSPGRQADTAERNGGAEAGFYLLEDVLPMTVGDLVLDDCEDARNLLDRRELDGRNKKRASDAAYYLASHLIAAQANVEAGASVCLEVSNAIAEANALLSIIGFDGTSSYLPPKKNGADRRLALELAALLDAYNNGDIC